MSEDREQQLDEIIAGFLQAQEAGRTVSEQEVISAHPDLADELREFFDDLGQMNDLAAPVVSQQPVLDKIRYFGDYELLEEIARGGMGIVYKARQSSLNRIVAVKLILSGHLASETDIKRFQTEAESAANLQHPHIVSVFEVGRHKAQSYFSMEFIDGKNLSEIVREHPLPAKQAAGYVRDVAEAIHYAHQQGTLHRDLKPSNVLIDQNDRVQITDFGLAMKVEGDSELTRTGQVLGTPSYMPPEQAQHKRGLIGPASDIYSMGAILYELLTGRPPFQADSPVETLRQVIETEPLSPRLLNPAVPKDLETICLKCLQKEPHKRYSTAQHLADDLGRFLQGEPILARPIGRVERAWRWAQRRPAVAALSAISVLLLLFASLLSMTAYYSMKQSLRFEQDALNSRIDGWREKAKHLSSSTNPDFPRAAELLTLALQERPTDPALLIARGELYYEMGQFDLALRDFESAEGIKNPSTSNQRCLLLLLAAHAISESELNRVQQIAMKASDDRFANFIYQSLTSDDLLTAVDSLSQAVEIQSDPRLFRERGRLNLALARKENKLEQFTDSIKDLSTAAEKRPFDSQTKSLLSLAFYQRGRLHENREDYAKAEDDFLNSLEHPPTEFNSVVHLGEFFSDCPDQTLRDPDRAAVLFQLALKYEPESPIVLLELSNLYHSSGQFGIARSTCNELLRLEPFHAQARLLSGHIHWGDREYQNAFADYSKSVELGATDRLTLVRQLISTPLPQQELVDDFLKFIAHEDHSSQAYRITSGAIHYRKHAWNDALALLTPINNPEERPPLTGPEDAIGSPWQELIFNWLFLSMTYWQLDEHGQARTFYEQVLEVKEKHSVSEGHLDSLIEEASALMQTASHWPHWRGPHMNGVSRAIDLPVNWSKTENIVWRRPLPGIGTSTPVVWGDRIFLTCGRQDDALLICIDETGQPLWSRKLGTHQVHPSKVTSSVTPSPNTDGKYIWALLTDGTLSCFDFEGSLLWTLDLKKRYGKIVLPFGLTSTPVVDGDRIYLQVIHGTDDDSQSAYVVALNKRTGEETWRTPRDTDAVNLSKHSYSSPIVYRDRHHQFLISHGADCAIAHSLQDGHELWRYRLQGKGEDYSSLFEFRASPVAANGIVVLPTAKNAFLAALSINSDDNESHVVSSEIWKKNHFSPDCSSPVLHDGLLYLLRSGGELFCLDARTGTTMYCCQDFRGRHNSSPVYADGKLYLPGRDGVVRVVRAGPVYELLAENDLGEMCMSSPAIVNHRIYMRTHEAIWAIEKGADWGVSEDDPDYNDFSWIEELSEEASPRF